MTATTTIRKQAELDELLNAHRVVRATLPFGVEVLECIAPLNIPEINVVEGQTFWLAASSYEGYCYPITRDGLDLFCGCKSWQYGHGSCKHTHSVCNLQVAKYRKQQELHDAEVIAPLVLGEEFAGDLDEHIADSIDNRDFVIEPQVAGSCDGCGRPSRRDLCAWCLGVAA